MTKTNHPTNRPSSSDSQQPDLLNANPDVRDRPVYVPPNGAPRVSPPNPAIYAAMGEANIFAMLRDFYAELERSPIRSLFPKDMERASQKSAAFFVGLVGGPPLYHQQYGSPMMRARHMPFAIDEEARRIWLACFAKVLEDAPARYNFPPEHIMGFWAFLEGFSQWMVNTAPEDAIDWQAAEESVYPAPEDRQDRDE